ncbi:dUTP diphosphatase [Massilia pseudoviolaceinigra]|uniref:dUTP diphosphatase n=1 Tax=Massilia pseudoviolaceinigra TaxID=3057165 RepID=UPI002796C154|nr:dUTP diphosphatase [Massilia sp. CCM 9206]MDQ1921647.1 dUTP diphosphatase [Massilia sp. CCM 9206]
MMKLKVMKLHPDAILPTCATDGASCFDLYALDGDDFKPHPRDQHAAIFRTGLAFEIPSGWIMEIHSRSGQGLNDAIRLSNCTGQIDSDYRGEVMVALRFDGDDDARCPKVRTGDRIAQAKLVASPRVEFDLVDELGETARGGGGIRQHRRIKRLVRVKRFGCFDEEKYFPLDSCEFAPIW